MDINHTNTHMKKKGRPTKAFDKVKSFVSLFDTFCSRDPKWASTEAIGNIYEKMFSKNVQYIKCKNTRRLCEKMAWDGLVHGPMNIDIAVLRKAFARWVLSTSIR